MLKKSITSDFKMQCFYVQLRKKYKNKKKYFPVWTET